MIQDTLAITGPSIKRGKSKQNYETPADFFSACGRRFGPCFVDLAATRENRKCDRYIDPEQNSMTVDWTLFAPCTAWLNPPFDRIAPWAAKCKLSAPPGGPLKILFLTPASIGANWFKDSVHGHALVLGLNGRLQFVGAEDPYPKDCMLSVFGVEPGFDVWTWR